MLFGAFLNSRSHSKITVLVLFGAFWISTCQSHHKEKHQKAPAPQFWGGGGNWTYDTWHYAKANINEIGGGGPGGKRATLSQCLNQTLRNLRRAFWFFLVLFWTVDLTAKSLCSCFLVLFGAFWICTYQNHHTQKHQKARKAPNARGGGEGR